MSSQRTETAFEAAIEQSLIASGGYEKRTPADFNPETALFPDDVLGFLQDSQPRKMDALRTLLGKRTEGTVLTSLVQELDLKGSLHVLRHGFKCYGKTLRMAFLRPNSGLNPDTAALYATNRLTITRQVAFASARKLPSGKAARCVIDVTLAVNGIPVVTAELKNPLTGQTWRNAIAQYQNERDARDRLFRFKERTLVHFAADPDEVWMTTRLRGTETRFLPFNRGNGDGAGNPPADGNWKTGYLWDEVLQADSLLDLLQRFVHLETSQHTVQTAKSTRTVQKETIIFPRYHQLGAVRSLVAHAREHGAGRNYLVQHSAGSGKSNSIAWLAHRLSTLHDKDDQKVFHTVVVVTDRRVLDSQLQDTIYQFEHKTGVVEKIDENTQQLARALSEGTPIVITTIQKFPFLMQAMETLEKKGEGVQIDTAGKRYAVIVDEAHSSQSGETAKTLRGMLNRDGIASAVAAQLLEDDSDDAPNAEALRSAMERSRQPNQSFFAFTATPKYKTKALFDEPGPSGASPFHEYSMRQAIEEGFILDVLQHYTTYKRFYGLIKQAEDDPEVSKKEAIKALTRFMELHPVNIEQVVEVIVEHFRRYVMHELGGKAKAMVVTGSRLAAVRYKRAFDAYIGSKGYQGIRSLVAFSGTVEDPDDGGSYTEPGMNGGVSESALPDTFERDDYRVLIVADKYQTGFDQPLLQTMYVVKKLSGVQAVQTLSRLNRTAPGKTRTFVLDFVNSEDDIYQAFKPYYEATPMGEAVDPHRLYELQHRLHEHALFTADDLAAFEAVWYRPRKDQTAADHRSLNAALDPVAQRFTELEEDEQEMIRGQLSAYRNLYAFLSQIIPYQDSELERLYAFARNLLSKLPRRSSGPAFELDDEVALRYYRLQQLSESSIDLGTGDAYPLKGPSDVGTGMVREAPARLSSLVDKLNDRLGTDFTDADQLFFDQVERSAQADPRIVEAAKANTLPDFKAFFEGALEELLIERMEGNEEIFTRLISDPRFRNLAQEHLAEEVYRGLQGGSEAGGALYLER
jgi:type I restriction enzyme R subunit